MMHNRRASPCTPSLHVLEFDNSYNIYQRMIPHSPTIDEIHCTVHTSSRLADSGGHSRERVQIFWDAVVGRQQ